MKKIDFGRDLSGIGVRLRQVRKLAGFSQSKMGGRVGVDNQSTYGNYEAGRAVPLDFIVHFHSVCNEELGICFTLDWLLTGEGKEPVDADSRTDVSSPESADIDRQISEELEIATQVIKQLFHRKYGETEPAILHPFLRDVPFVIFDQMTVIRYASPGLCELLKAKPEAVIGQSTTRFLPQGEVDRVIPEQIQAMEEKGYWAGEILLQTSDLKKIRCLHFQFLVRDNDGLPCMGNIVIPMGDIREIRKDMDIYREKIMRHVRWEISVAQEPR